MRLELQSARLMAIDVCLTLQNPGKISRRFFSLSLSLARSLSLFICIFSLVFGFFRSLSTSYSSSSNIFLAIPVYSAVSNRLHASHTAVSTSLVLLFWPASNVLSLLSNRLTSSSERLSQSTSTHWYTLEHLSRNRWQLL